MKTVLFSTLLSDAICAAVIASLWIVNRRHFAGMGLWFADFALQLLAVIFLALRGVMPTLSIMLGSPLIMGGAILLYMGLERYMERKGRQLWNAAGMVLFVLAQAYFGLVDPSLRARNLLLSAGLLWVSGRCAWLILRKADQRMRSDIRPAGLVFAAYALFSLSRIAADILYPPGVDLFHSAAQDVLVVIAYQMLQVALTFGLALAVNRRLMWALEQDIIRRTAAEERVGKLLAEKELLLRETHHRVTNNMSIVVSLLGMQASMQEDDASREVIDDAARRVQHMAELYDKLYRAENSASMALGEFLPPLLEEIVAVFLSLPAVSIHTDIDGTELDPKRLSALGIILNELVTNSMKYAFKREGERVICVSAHRRGDRVSLSYADNGVGMPESAALDGSKGFGRQLINALVGQLGGSLEMPSSEGTAYTISFPL